MWRYAIGQKQSNIYLNILVKTQTELELCSTSSSKIDEIKNYSDCRYLSTYESCWRLFEYRIHHREPYVQRLVICLSEEHNIYFSDTQSIPGIISIPTIEKTMFTKWTTQMN